MDPRMTIRVHRAQILRRCDPVLAVLLAVYLLLATIYSVTTPLFEASDELWHYPVVKYLADHALQLPVQAANLDTAWRQQGSQPPLYYILSAFLTAGINTADIEQVRVLNRHADIGAVVPDGNYNMALHDPAVESFPWRGTVLAVHIVRFFSVALGALTVVMAYLLTRELFPTENRHNWLALSAVALTAFNPMFLFISSSVNNDNLSNAIASTLLVFTARLLTRRERIGARSILLLGTIAGLGMLAKFNLGFLLPVIGLALLVISWHARSWRLMVSGGLITAGLVVTISGWWYVRNMQLYSDPTGLNMFLQIVGRRSIPANLPQLWSERETFLMSYWGLFGGVNLPLPAWMYSAFNGLALLAVVGLLIGLGRFVRLGVSGALRHEKFGLLVAQSITIFWIGILFVGLLRWTSETWASQGRLMFSAIAPLNMWMTVGLCQIGQATPRIRWYPVGLTAIWFFFAAWISLFHIRQAYDPVTQMTAAESAPSNVQYAKKTPAMATFCEPLNTETPPCIRVEKYMFEASVRVGDYLRFHQEITVVPASGFTQDWSAFIHLVNADGLIVGQRDVYLRQGRWSTRFAGRQRADGFYLPTVIWLNYFAIQLPDHAYAPQELSVYLGFYDAQTNARMILDPPEANNMLLLGRVFLMPRYLESSIPNATRVNFGNEAELLGYNVSNLVLRSGQQFTVTLYWRRLRPITTSFRVFVQTFVPGTTHVMASSDAVPAAWSRPTTSWSEGEIVVDRHTLSVSPETQPDKWQLAVGLYEFRDDIEPRFRRLRVITPDGRQADDYLSLTQLKVQ